LEALHNAEASEVMKRLEQESKVEEHEQGSVVSLSKEEQQRDRRAKMVKRGVFERGKLQELYLGRRKEMEAAQGRVREELKAEKETRLQEQMDQYKRAIDQLEVEHS